MFLHLWALAKGTRIASQSLESLDRCAVAQSPWAYLNTVLDTSKGFGSSPLGKHIQWQSLKAID